MLIQFLSQALTSDANRLSVDLTALGHYVFSVTFDKRTIIIIKRAEDGSDRFQEYFSSDKIIFHPFQPSQLA